MMQTSNENISAMVVSTNLIHRLPIELQPLNMNYNGFLRQTPGRTSRIHTICKTNVIREREIKV